MNKKDNEFLYLLKLIACLFVITIHAPFEGVFGEYVTVIARAAVPFFFAVSGRFLLADYGYFTNASDFEIRARALARLIKTLKVTAIVYLIHLIFSLAVNLWQGMTLASWAEMKFNAGEAFNFIFFNSGRFIYDGSYTFDHMWYLFALIYVYVLIIIFAKVLRRWYIWVTALCLGMLFFGEWLRIHYPIRPFGINICTWYVLRNWLFVGLPFVLLGIIYADLISKRRAQLRYQDFDGLLQSFGFGGLFVTGAGIILSCLEYYLAGSKEVYISSVIIVFGLLMLSDSGMFAGKHLWKLGKYGSSRIYFYHVLVIAVLDLLSMNGRIPQYTMSQKPLLVMGICLLIFGVLPAIYGEHLKGRKNEQTTVS